ncbi:unnamed protein product (macronuclear) [Paramecium tetraurelia]|uniref:HMG box domain-containing protein n=1 Tax=Paramecium tetraurelia TaxID=5888 RepID=A0EIP0_PARTE|nr:uncharacterized protein GSPATT00027510001 [Paramecium tetraurelia]CAK95181.1 unnamed protein product [Paramecium tetraurelia]|eukprot:XP_001462554.1 hypothetical protein (macronuclear) [Paramecium tetraurelia strain d4-2]
MTDNNTKKEAPPKRPQCAFFIYKQEVYQQVKDANPGKKMTDITKIISEQYKQLAKDKIDQYEQKYKDSKAIFEKEKKAYEDVHGKIKNERKKKKDDTKVTKKPQNKKQKKQASEEDDSSEDDD